MPFDLCTLGCSPVYGGQFLSGGLWTARAPSRRRGCLQGSVHPDRDALLQVRLEAGSHRGPPNNPAPGSTPAVALGDGRHLRCWRHWAAHPQLTSASSRLRSSQSFFCTLAAADGNRTCSGAADAEVLPMPAGPAARSRRGASEFRFSSLSAACAPSPSGSHPLLAYSCACRCWSRAAAC